MTQVIIAVTLAAAVVSAMKVLDCRKRRISAHKKRIARRNRNVLRHRFNVWQFENNICDNSVKYKTGVTIICKNPALEAVFAQRIKGGEET